MKSLLALVPILAVALAQPNSDVLENLFGAFDKCGGGDPASCLKVKVVRLLDRALATDSLAVSEYVTISKDPKVKIDNPLQTKGDIESSLPRDLKEKSSTLDKMLLDRFLKYLQTRTVKLNVPTDVFEGREKGFKGYKKGKGGGIYVLMFGAMGAFLLQLFMAKIALIAGKALLVGKVALLLAGVIGLKSLLSHKEEKTSQVIYAEPEFHHSGSGGWGRSGTTHVPEAAHDIAYRGQRSIRH